MITQKAVERVIEKHQLKPLKNSFDPRGSVTQVIKELQEKGMNNAQIADELGMAESSVRVILRADNLGV
jgi:DNA-binding NarL/FixJ family response regulator